MVKGLFALVLVSTAALAAPPPPALYPRNLPQQVAGYDLPPIYSAYDFWVNRGRKAALTNAIPYESAWQGKHYWGTLVDSELLHYDFGVIRVDRLDRYCAGDWLEDQPPGGCEYRYRYAFVPGSLYSDDDRDQRILESFRPERLTALLSASGWKPVNPQNVWSDERLIKIFEAHTDLAAFYAPYVEFHEARSSTCPGLRNSVARLDSIELDLTPDAIKLDSKSPTFPIHGEQTQIRLTASTSKGARVIIEGAEPLYYLLKPVWAAVERCSPPKK